MRFLTVILSILLLSNAALAGPFQADAKTKRIPAGTKLKIQLIEPLSTNNGQEGDYFSAMLLNDQKRETSVILPAGSVIRGSIDKITPTKRLSRGGVLYLDFDHIVTPNGRQLPIDIGLSGRSDLTLDGGIYGSKGYGEALQKNWANTVNITKKSTEYGLSVGEGTAAESVKYITTPICAIGGAFGGGAYLVGDSFIDLFRKGSEVTLNQGSVIDVVLTQPIDVPVY